MSGPDTIHGLKHDEISAIVSKGVQDAFYRLGIQVDDPIQMQRDFQYLREWRESMEQVKRRGLLAAVGTLISGLFVVIWIGAKAILNNHGT